MNTRLALGTAQFGMDYGVSNRAGCTSDREMEAILSRCREVGVDTLDTAAAYGDAEERLGTKLPPDWLPRIVTKVLPLSEGVARAEQGIHQSLARLGREKIFGLLVHRGQDLLDDDGPELWRCLERLKDQGCVEKIGVSVYTADELDKLIGRYPLQLVQLPCSLLDQRLVQSGMAERLKRSGIEIHVRSIFLQGLIFLKGGEIPAGLAFARTAIERVQARLSNAGVTPLQAALAYVFSQPEFDAVVAGVSSLGELNAILDVIDAQKPQLDWDSFALSDERVLNPARWTVQ